ELFAKGVDVAVAVHGAVAGMVAEVSVHACGDFLALADAGEGRKRLPARREPLLDGRDIILEARRELDLCRSQKRHGSVKQQSILRSLRDEERPEREQNNGEERFGKHPPASPKRDDRQRDAETE